MRAYGVRRRVGVGQVQRLGRGLEHGWRRRSRAIALTSSPRRLATTNCARGARQAGRCDPGVARSVVPLAAFEPHESDPRRALARA
jgi:hypothetical protein